MSELAANPVPEPRITSRRVQLLAVFFFITQLALLFLLGTKRMNVPRAVTNVPHLTLANDSDELVALGDPTLFVLPHLNDFSTRLWLPIPQADAPDFRYREEPRWLALDTRNLGAALKDYLQTNAAAETPLNFKPEPVLEFPPVNTEVFLPTNSTLQLFGALARRKLSATVVPPLILKDDVIAPSRVQLLVNPDGSVQSVVLLESSGLEAADQSALKLATSAQFAPAAELMFGEMLFNWHTVTTTNLTEPK